MAFVHLTLSNLILLIIVITLLVLIIKKHNLIKAYKDNYENLFKQIQTEREKSLISFEADIDSKATLFKKMEFTDGHLDIEIPVILKEKNHDGTLLRFKLDDENIPSTSVFQNSNTLNMIKMYLEQWYSTGSLYITWKEIKSKDLFLDFAEIVELKSLIHYSLIIPEYKKQKIYKLLNIKNK